MKYINKFNYHKKLLEETYHSLNEFALHQKDLEEFINYISTIDDTKKLVSIIKSLISKLQDKIKNISLNDIQIIYDTKSSVYFIELPDDIKIIIAELNKLIYKYAPSNQIDESYDDINDDIDEEDIEKYNKYKTFMNLIYPEGTIHKWIFEFTIEKNNLNRIHFNKTLPIIIRKFGFMTKVYKKFIDTLKFISTNPIDRTLDIEFVWLSLSKDSNYYTFVEYERSICFSSKCKFDFIITKLKEFKTSDEFILDSDFKAKYKEELLNTEFTYLIK